MTGVGGVGKTRLALQAAAEVLPEFREGAWLVELAPVRDPDGVVDAFAAVFGVTARAGQTLEESLAEFLRTKQLLLVVDNCEHLLEPVADLVEVLERSCRAVSILATSREGLALDGERVVRGAVVGRAGRRHRASKWRRVRTRCSCSWNVLLRSIADFVLSGENAAAVVQICRRLDGVPLAIELAAARVTTMSPAELARGLDRRFDTLAGGRRRAVKRHQTLRAAIDWSYDLLSEARAATVGAPGGLLRWLHPRRGRGGLCGRAARGAGACSGSWPSWWPGRWWSRERDGPETRYRLLETIREYGEERLAEHDETDVLRRRHAESTASSRVSSGPSSRVRGQIEAGRRVTAEQENLLAAMNYAIDTDDVDSRCGSLRNDPGPNQTGYELRVSVDAIHLPGASRTPLYPYALALAALFAAFRGERQAAEALGDDALAAARRLDSDLGPRVELIGVQRPREPRVPDRRVARRGRPRGTFRRYRPVFGLELLDRVEPRSRGDVSRDGRRSRCRDTPRRGRPRARSSDRPTDQDRDEPRRVRRRARRRRPPTRPSVAA